MILPEIKKGVTTYEIEAFWGSDMDRFDSFLGSVVLIADANAFTTNTAWILSQKPAHLFLVNERNIKSAQQIFPDAAAVGESDDPQVKPLFVCSNSPYELVSKVKSGEFTIAGEDIL